MNSNYKKLTSELKYATKYKMSLLQPSNFLCKPRGLVLHEPLATDIVLQKDFIDIEYYEKVTYREMWYAV